MSKNTIQVGKMIFDNFFFLQLPYMVEMLAKSDCFFSN